MQAPVLTREQRDNLFWINTAIGAALAVAVFLSSWGIAALYGQEELAPLAQLASITFLLNGLATQFRASLNRMLRFAALAKTDVIAAVAGLGIGIGVALTGVGPWALVAHIPRNGTGDARPRRRRSPAGGRTSRDRGPHRRVRPFRVEHGRHADGHATSATTSTPSSSGCGSERRNSASTTAPSSSSRSTANQLRAPITTVAVPVLSRLQGRARGTGTSCASDR